MVRPPGLGCEGSAEIFLAIYGVREVLFMDHLLRKSDWKMLEFGAQSPLVTVIFLVFSGLQHVWQYTDAKRSEDREPKCSTIPREVRGEMEEYERAAASEASISVSRNDHILARSVRCSKPRSLPGTTLCHPSHTWSTESTCHAN